MPVGASWMVRWVSSSPRSVVCETGSRSISSAVSLTRSAVSSGASCRPARSTRKSASCGSRSHCRRVPGMAGERLRLGMRPLECRALFGCVRAHVVADDRQVAQIVGALGVDLLGAHLVVRAAVQRGGREQQHEREEQRLSARSAASRWRPARRSSRRSGSRSGRAARDAAATAAPAAAVRGGGSMVMVPLRVAGGGTLRRCLEDQPAHGVSSRAGFGSGDRASCASSASPRDKVGPAANWASTDHGIGSGGGVRPRAATAFVVFDAVAHPGVADPEQRARAVDEVAAARRQRDPVGRTAGSGGDQVDGPLSVGQRQRRTRQQGQRIRRRTFGFRPTRARDGIVGSIDQGDRLGRVRAGVEARARRACAPPRRRRAAAAGPGQRSWCCAGSRPGPAKPAAGRRRAPRSSGSCCRPRTRRRLHRPAPASAVGTGSAPRHLAMGGAVSGGASGTVLNSPAAIGRGAGMSTPMPSASVTARLLRSIALRLPSHSSQVRPSVLDEHSVVVSAVRRHARHRRRAVPRSRSPRPRHPTPCRTPSSRHRESCSAPCVPVHRGCRAGYRGGTGRARSS